MNKLLIIGNGFIGKNLYKYFSLKYDTIISNRNILNISDSTSIKKFFINTNFTHIIYAAGLKNVQWCENNHRETLHINAIAIYEILRSINLDTKFIYISTDYVFDGNAGLYTEMDQTNPLTFYGKSKLIGEIFTQTFSNNSIIVRTSGVYGDGCLWMNWLLSELDNHKNVECFSDVINSPTYAINLAEMVDDVCVSSEYGYKIFNLSGPPVDRLKLYKSVAHAYHKNVSLLRSSKDTHNFPKNISLDTSLYTKLTGKYPNTITEGLNRLIK